MIISLGKWRKRFKYLLLFIALSYVLYSALSFIGSFLEPKERYREPAGHAVKVIQQEAAWEERISMKERLLMFYRYGE